ncbi:hypothetical protein AOLI_G00190340 [Acnodon oligacanthus]
MRRGTTDGAADATRSSPLAAIQTSLAKVGHGSSPRGSGGGSAGEVRGRAGPGQDAHLMSEDDEPNRTEVERIDARSFSFPPIFPQDPPAERCDWLTVHTSEPCSLSPRR